MGSAFGPFWYAKYLNFGSESCEIRILSCSIEETHIRENEKPGFTFYLEMRINSKMFRVIS